MDERLSSLVSLHIDKHKDVDIDGVITEFAHLKGRRLARQERMKYLHPLLFSAMLFDLLRVDERYFSNHREITTLNSEEWFELEVNLHIVVLKYHLNLNIFCKKNMCM